MMKKITIDVSVDSKSARLEGYGIVEQGYLEGSIVPTHGDWKLRDYTLLTAFTFTGCPIVAFDEVSNPDLNPWIASNGAYNSKRTLHHDDFGVTANLLSRSKNDEIHMQLDLVVNGDLPDFIDVAYPFQEEMKPYSDTEIRGEFTIPFKTTEQAIYCKAETIYELPIPPVQPTVYRNIMIRNNPLESFHQIEQIALFSNRQRANDDLAAKLQFRS